MRRDLGVFFLVARPAFAQPAPAKLVTLDIAAVGVHGQAIPDLRSSEIEIFDNRKAQSIVYWRSNQRRPDIPHVTDRPGRLPPTWYPYRIPKDHAARVRDLLVYRFPFAWRFRAAFDSDTFDSDTIGASR